MSQLIPISLWRKGRGLACFDQTPHQGETGTVTRSANLDHSAQVMGHHSTQQPHNGIDAP